MVRASPRQQIVEAADRMFYEQGFEHTSFSAIAKAVELSKGNFHYHFKTKDDILAAVIEARLADTRRMLASWEADEPTPAVRIGRFIEKERLEQISRHLDLHGRTAGGVGQSP